MMTAQPLLKPETNEFTVASMNQQRFIGSAASDVRIAKAASAIRDVLQMPDIIGVQEIGDLKTLNAIGGPLGYTGYLEPGNDPGGSNIGLLVKRSRVTVNSVVQQGKNDGFIDPATGKAALLFDQPPLMLDAVVDGYPVLVVATNLLSVHDQTGVTAAAKRKSQVDYMTALIRQKQNANLILAGGFNAYADVMDAIKAAGASVLGDTLPREQGYSYVFEGSAETLDNIVVNANGRKQWTRVAYSHVNADYPASFGSDDSRPERFSDHDIPVAWFSTKPVLFSAAAMTNAATFLTGPVAPNEIVTIFAPGVTADTKVLFDGAPVTIFGAASTQISAVAPDWLAGRVSTEVTVQFDASRSAKATLEVNAASPGIFVLNAAGQGAVLNQDYSVNGPGAPAVKGSVIMIYATGGGAVSRLGAPLVAVTIGGKEAEVQFSGQAPGLINGALQVNVKVPDSAPAGDAVSVVLTMGPYSSARGVTIAIR
jgi:uncharacterized protein (TIGR03437 family)